MNISIFTRTFNTVLSASGGHPCDEAAASGINVDFYSAIAFGGGLLLASVAGMLSLFMLGSVEELKGNPAIHEAYFGLKGSMKPPGASRRPVPSSPNAPLPRTPLPLAPRAPRVEPSPASTRPR